MKKFEIGKTYSCKSVCGNDCVWSYTVIARTAKMVTLSDGNKIIKRRIIAKLSEYRDAESVYPLGQFAMAPILSA